MRVHAPTCFRGTPPRRHKRASALCIGLPTSCVWHPTRPMPPSTSSAAPTPHDTHAQRDQGPSSPSPPTAAAAAGTAAQRGQGLSPPSPPTAITAAAAGTAAQRSVAGGPGNDGGAGAGREEAGGAGGEDGEGEGDALVPCQLQLCHAAFDVELLVTQVRIRPCLLISLASCARGATTLPRLCNVVFGRCCEGSLLLLLHSPQVVAAAAAAGNAADGLPGSPLAGRRAPRLLPPPPFPPESNCLPPAPLPRGALSIAAALAARLRKRSSAHAQRRR